MGSIKKNGFEEEKKNHQSISRRKEEGSSVKSEGTRELKTKKIKKIWKIWKMKIKTKPLFWKEKEKRKREKVLRSRKLCARLSVHWMMGRIPKAARDKYIYKDSIEWEIIKCYIIWTNLDQTN